MSRARAVWAAVVLLCLGGVAQAITIDTVHVGNPGNTPDTRYGIIEEYGEVGYAYRIGKYEVTAGQYAQFLNYKAKTDTYGLYNPAMGSPTVYLGCNIQRSGSADSYTYSVASDWANRPVNWVSFWDACRFANWLHNGGGYGDTENGAYALNGYTGADGRGIARNPGARWAVPSEDEWYKAAYHRNDGATGNYWDYPTATDAVPSNVGADGYIDPGNHANFTDYLPTLGSPYYRTNVGEFENSASPYGTFDQGGNVWEWNETVIYDAYVFRKLRGGDFADDSSHMHVLQRFNYVFPTYEGTDSGFRVVQVVPEPSALLALAGGLMPLIGVRRRRTC